MAKRKLKLASLDGNSLPTVEELGWALRTVLAVYDLNDRENRFDFVIKKLLELTSATSAGACLIHGPADENSATIGSPLSLEGICTAGRDEAVTRRRSNGRGDVAIPETVANAINTVFGATSVVDDGGKRDQVTVLVAGETEVLLSRLALVRSDNRPPKKPAHAGVLWLSMEGGTLSATHRVSMHLLQSGLGPFWFDVLDDRAPNVESVLRVSNKRVVLTERQHDVLQPLLAGRSEQQSAQIVGMSVHTFHEHVKQLYKKYRVSSRAELMAKVLGGNGSVRTKVG